MCRFAQRVGSPVVLTTTTDERVFADDETRFLSLRADESDALNRKILRRRFVQHATNAIGPSDDVWREAVRLIAIRPPKLRYPKWLGLVAELMPAGEPRARRDGERFCSLLEAVALCRSFSDGRRTENRKELQISFADYCIAYQITSEAFSATYRGMHPQALRIAECVREWHRNSRKTITIKELAQALGWDVSVTYKWVNVAVKGKLVVLHPGTNEKNLKRYGPGTERSTRFLPDPATVLNGCEELEGIGGFVDPLTGGWKKVRRTSGDGGHHGGKAA